MPTRLLLIVAAALLMLRVPAIAQPMGADQGLYAYVGERILAGELPYRDAWDQKPPAIHYTYALMRAAWSGDGAVGAADLLAAGTVAWLLYRLGAVTGSSAAGAVSALVFLLLSNPSLTRLGGIRLRAQCETFIAVVVAGGLLLLLHRTAGTRPVRVLAAGILFGLAFLFKYNAGIYLVSGVLAAWLWRRIAWRDLMWLGGGFALPLIVALAIFTAGGALGDLYDATITYNLRYSGETYAGPFAVVRYLLTFPIERASVDALWTVGGAGCLILIPLSLAKRERLVAPLWVAAACLSIAINGSRGLPQYFVQANPALALAAGWGAIEAWALIKARAARHAPAVGLALIVIVAVAVWRVDQFPKLVEQTLFDARYALGRIDRETYLSRYGDDRKFSALSAAALADTIRSRTHEGETVYVFGFTCAAYVQADRASASRFFWSRPVIAGFEADRPGYGVAGLLGELQRHAPALVALQRKDWAPDVTDSAEFFMRTAPLAGWLEANYIRTGGPDAFDVWVRKDGRS